MLMNKFALYLNFPQCIGWREWSWPGIWGDLVGELYVSEGGEAMVVTGMVAIEMVVIVGNEKVEVK